MKRNGKVDFLRFVFSIIVMLFHIRGKYHIKILYDGFITLTFFNRGNLGVEFFFVLSGFLMARSVFHANQQNRELSVARSTTQFIKRKFIPLMPMNIAATGILFIISCVLGNLSFIPALEKLLRAIPGLFFIQISGVASTTLNPYTWFLSAMLFSYLILYPLIYKNYSVFVRIIAPLVSLLLLGYLSHTYGSLGGAAVWTPICRKALLRAIGEIALGAVCFEIYRLLSQRTFSKLAKMSVTIIEIACFAFAILLCTIKRPVDLDIYVLGFMCVGLICAFTQEAYGSRFFQHRFFGYLGKLSLSLFLVHRIAVRVVPHFVVSLPLRYQVLLTILAALILAIIFTALNERFFRYRKLRKAQQPCRN